MDDELDIVRDFFFSIEDLKERMIPKTNKFGTLRISNLTKQDIKNCKRAIKVNTSRAQIPVQAFLDFIALSNDRNQYHYYNNMRVLQLYLDYVGLTKIFVNGVEVVGEAPIEYYEDWLKIRNDTQGEYIEKVKT